MIQMGKYPREPPLSQPWKLLLSLKELGRRSSLDLENYEYEFQSLLYDPQGPGLGLSCLSRPDLTWPQTRRCLVLSCQICRVQCLILAMALPHVLVVDDVIVGPLVLLSGLGQIARQSYQLLLHVQVLLGLSDLLLLIVVVQDALTRQLGSVG